MTLAAHVRRRALDWLETVLVLSGILAISWSSGAVIEREWFQRREAAALAKMEPDDSSRASSAAKIPRRAAIGTIRIPRLQMSAVIAEGDDETVLRRAVGHLPDTPLPWSGGNSVLAGHRDSYFRPLEYLVRGDVIEIDGPRGALEYRVRQTFMVNPQEVWVMDAADRPTLTLITCYPFTYIGHAPFRFVVQADRVTSGTTVRPVMHRPSRSAR